MCTSLLFNQHEGPIELPSAASALPFSHVHHYIFKNTLIGYFINYLIINYTTMVRLVIAVFKNMSIMRLNIMKITFFL